MISVDEWIPADNLILEPNALRAAKNTQNSLALTAGPGAGKTEMLAQRADFLLRTNICCYPKRILAISFKVDASRNLKERVQRRCGLELGARFDSYTFHGFAKRIIDRFRPILTGRDALNVDYTIGGNRIDRKQITFNDLVPLAIQIIEVSNLAVNAIRQTYTHVFLDEFQDCTSEQYKLIHKTFLGTQILLTAVGDTKQKIMGWAGAMEGIFNTYAQNFNAIPLQLYRNFRSKPKLLQMQNEIIRVLDSESVMPPAQISGDEGDIYTHEFEDSFEEADVIADLIQNWIEIELVPISEIAVLISKQIELYAGPLMAALEEREISFRNEQQLQDVSTEPVSRLIVDYLSCLFNKRNPKAWARLIEQLLPYDDSEAELKIRHDLSKLIRKQRQVFQNNDSLANWWPYATSFLKEIGQDIVVALSSDYENKIRLREIILETKKRIEDLLKIEPQISKALEKFYDDQAVRILTIHKSKGLEFDSVVILAVENEIFFGKQQDERCAFFVGISRAKRRLVLTCAKFRKRPEGYSGRWNEQRSIQSEFWGYSQ